MKELLKRNKTHQVKFNDVTGFCKLHRKKNPPKVVIISDFMLTFAMSF